MSTCDFSIGFSESPVNLIEKAAIAIKKADGIFDGNVESGTFLLSTPFGKVNGEYFIKDSVINIQIKEKPIFLSCTKIQRELENYLVS